MKLYKQFTDDNALAYEGPGNPKVAVYYLNKWLKDNKNKLLSYSIASDIPNQCGGSIIVLAYKFK